MTVYKALQEGFKFGKKTHEEFLPFMMKFLALAIPGVLLGHYLDQGIYKLQIMRIFGQSPATYVSIQMFLWAVMFYGFFRYATAYADEFQGSIAGIFFIALFFTVQTHYVDNLQKVLGIVDKDL